MADSAITKWIARPGVSFATRYGLALASVTGAVLLELLFRYFNLPHPFTAFALSAIAATFWYAGTKPGLVAVLLSSLIRGFIVEEATGSPSRALYNLVFLLLAVLMIWVRRSKETREVADRTAELTAANEEFRREKEQLDGLFELSPRRGNPDRVQLDQVMMNLMINGIDPMNDVDGARELAIKAQKAQGHRILVSVSDTWVGLPVQQADQIFKAFFTTKPQGTGMGLSISHSIVESHDERLWAADNTARGANLYFTLPTKAEVRE
jgi:hypothetical protein